MQAEEVNLSPEEKSKARATMYGKLRLRFQADNGWTSQLIGGKIEAGCGLAALINNSPSATGHTLLLIEGDPRGAAASWIVVAEMVPLEGPPQEGANRDQVLWDEDKKANTRRLFKDSEKLSGLRDSRDAKTEKPLLIPGLVKQHSGHGETHIKEVNAEVAKRNLNKVVEMNACYMVEMDKIIRLTALIQDDISHNNDEPPRFPYAATIPTGTKTYNCHTWALDVLARAGVDVDPSIAGTITPNTLDADKKDDWATSACNVCGPMLGSVLQMIK
jgi:hypothetical protein